jgi:hypothetical protein
MACTASHFVLEANAYTASFLHYFPQTKHFKNIPVGGLVVWWSGGLVVWWSDTCTRWGIHNINLLPRANVICSCTLVLSSYYLGFIFLFAS